MKEHILGAGEGPVIQFMHANAYTPGCYKQLSKYLSNYKVILPEQRPLFKNSDPRKFKSWNILADDLIEHMDRCNRKNVIGAGHSMGGVATWLAAIKRPDLFRFILMVDPVILPKNGTWMIRNAPMVLKKKLFPMIKIASRRRDQWNNRQEAHEHFLKKKLFQRFDPEAFEDFIEYGLREKDDKVVLTYPRKWEARIYGTPPNLWKIMHHTPCPIIIIRAEFSDVISDDRWVKIQNRIVNGVFYEMKKVGHLVPFEQPEKCAGLIKKILENQSF